MGYIEMWLQLVGAVEVCNNHGRASDGNQVKSSCPT